MKKNKLISNVLSTTMACICAFTCTACSQGTVGKQDVVKFEDGMSYVETVKGTPFSQINCI